MKTYRKTIDDQTHFVVADVDPALLDEIEQDYLYWPLKQSTRR